MALEFVVPSKLILAIEMLASLAQRHCPGGNFHDLANRRWARWEWRDRRNSFLVERKIMEKIGEGLCVHQPMLERNREQLLWCVDQQIIDGLSHAHIILLNLLYCGPIRALVLWELPWLRINPERKELVEFRME